MLLAPRVILEPHVTRNRAAIQHFPSIRADLHLFQVLVGVGLRLVAPQLGDFVAATRHGAVQVRRFLQLMEPLVRHDKLGRAACCSTAAYEGRRVRKTGDAIPAGESKAASSCPRTKKTTRAAFAAVASRPTCCARQTVSASRVVSPRLRRARRGPARAVPDHRRPEAVKLFARHLGANGRS